MPGCEGPPAEFLVIKGPLGGLRSADLAWKDSRSQRTSLVPSRCSSNGQYLNCGAYTDPCYTIVNPLTGMADRSQMRRRYAKPLQGRRLFARRVHAGRVDDD